MFRFLGYTNFCVLRLVTWSIRIANLIFNFVIRRRRTLPVRIKNWILFVQEVTRGTNLKTRKLHELCNNLPKIDHVIIFEDYTKDFSNSRLEINNENLSTSHRAFDAYQRAKKRKATRYKAALSTSDTRNDRKLTRDLPLWNVRALAKTDVWEAAPLRFRV